MNGPFPQETRPSVPRIWFAALRRLPLAPNLLPINGHGRRRRERLLVPDFCPRSEGTRGRGGRRVAERTKPGVINGWDSIWGQSTFSPSSLVFTPCLVLLACPSTLPMSFAFSFHVSYPCTSTPPLLHTILFPPSTSSFRYISPPDPLLAIYHSKSRTIRSRVRNTGILESFEPLRPPPVDILAYLPVFTRTTRLELVRALASLLMQLSD